MRSGAQLKLRGMRPEAIETAREAARRAGVSLSEWIDTAIERAADPGARTGPQPNRHEDSADPGERYAQFHHRFDEIAARLDRLAQRAEAPGPARAPAVAPHADRDPAVGDRDSPLPDVMRDPDRPGDSPPHRLANAIGQLDKRLDQLIADKGTPDRAPTRPPAASAGRSFSLDEAIAEISARQHALDMEADGSAPPAPDLSGVEQLLHNITGQIETLRQPCAAEDAFAALQRELAGIGRTVAEAIPRDTLDAIQSELRSLAERIDHRPSADDDPALSGIERGLNEVRDALQALAPAAGVAGSDDEARTLPRRVDAIASTGPDGETLEHLETAIAELRGVSARVASGEALAALASDVRTIGTKLDRVAPLAAPDHDGMDHIVRRIESLAAALEGRAGASAPSEGAQTDVLIKRLTDKLETVESVAGGRAFDQLEIQIAQLSQKLEAADARLGNLGVVERVVADLMERLHDTRASALEAAEQAARTAAREMMASAGSGPEVEALKRELAEFRSAQADIDRRTQDMLEALHGTLERLVDRLAAIETDMQARPLSGTDALPPAPPAAPSMSRPLPAAAKPAGDRRALNPSLPADHPLEPGTGAPRGRAATPAERIAASEAMLPTAKPATAEPAGKANFIAAARRAAQAAAADASADGTRTPDDRASGSLLGPLRGAIARHRRPLLIGVGVALLVLGTLQLMTNFLGVRPTPGETIPSVPAPQSSGPATPAEAPPAPGHQSENIPSDPTAADPASASPRVSSLGAPPDGKTPIVPTSPLPGFSAVRTPADVTGSVAVAPAATPPGGGTPQPAAADKPLPTTVGPGLRNAALAGNPAAEYELAIRYADGRGVPASVDEAVRWFERAANHGLAPAQYRLGSLYEKGQGVKKDLETARRLYTAAAEKGNGKAMHNLAVLYAEGLNGEPDYLSASQWFRKAADHGIADSQYNLGILYARGIGVEQNLAESYKWFALAAQQGDRDATKKRDDVAARLDAQLLVAARLAVQTWTADPQPEEAVEVKSPPGGWEKPAPASRPAKAKPAVGPPRKLTPT